MIKIFTALVLFLGSTSAPAQNAEKRFGRTAIILTHIEHTCDRILDSWLLNPPALTLFIRALDRGALVTGGIIEDQISKSKGRWNRNQLAGLGDPAVRELPANLTLAYASNYDLQQFHFYNLREPTRLFDVQGSFQRYPPRTIVAVDRSNWRVLGTYQGVNK